MSERLEDECSDLREQLGKALAELERMRSAGVVVFAASEPSKALKWREHEASDPHDMVMRAAFVDVTGSGTGATLNINCDIEDPTRSWGFDVEVDALIETPVRFNSEAEARRAVHECALDWARRLVIALEKAIP